MASYGTKCVTCVPLAQRLLLWQGARDLHRSQRNAYPGAGQGSCNVARHASALPHWPPEPQVQPFGRYDCALCICSHAWQRALLLQFAFATKICLQTCASGSFCCSAAAYGMCLPARVCCRLMALLCSRWHCQHWRMKYHETVHASVHRLVLQTGFLVHDHPVHVIKIDDSLRGFALLRGIAP